MLAWEDTRAWTSLWISYPNGDVVWRDPNSNQSSSEQMFVAGGFLRLAGFDHRWSANCTSAEVEDIASGARFPLDCSTGHPYSPMLVPRDPWRMRVWGLIDGTRKFYWESDFYPNETAFNPCWYQGPQTKDVIRQLDSWWDDGAGWVRASAPSLPFDPQGRPVRPSVTKYWEVTLARGFGIWTIRDKASGRNLCLYSTWEWH